MWGVVLGDLRLPFRGSATDLDPWILQEAALLKDYLDWVLWAPRTVSFERVVQALMLRSGLGTPVVEWLLGTKTP